MTFADLVVRTIKRVKVVHVGDGPASSSKHMATVAEPYLIAALERNGIVILDRVREDIHKQ